MRMNHPCRHWHLKHTVLQRLAGRKHIRTSETQQSLPNQYWVSEVSLRCLKDHSKCAGIHSIRVMTCRISTFPGDSNRTLNQWCYNCTCLCLIRNTPDTPQSFWKSHASLCEPDGAGATINAQASAVWQAEEATSPKLGPPVAKS